MPLWDVTAGSATTEGSPAQHWQYLSCIYYTLTRKFTNLGASMIVFTFFTFFHIFTPEKCKAVAGAQKKPVALRSTASCAELSPASSQGSQPTRGVPALISSPNPSWWPC